MYLDSLSDENPQKTKKTFPCIRFVHKAIDERPELPSLELGQVTMTPFSDVAANTTGLATNTWGLGAKRSLGQSRLLCSHTRALQFKHVPGLILSYCINLLFHCRSAIPANPAAGKGS